MRSFDFDSSRNHHGQSKTETSIEIALTSLGDVGARGHSLPQERAEHLQKVVSEIISSNFSKLDGKPKAERTIAAKLGISQPTLNKLRQGKGCGVQALLALRNYTGRTIDELLGFSKSSGQPVPDAARVQEWEAALSQLRHLQTLLEALRERDTNRLQV